MNVYKNNFKYTFHSHRDSVVLRVACFYVSAEVKREAA